LHHRQHTPCPGGHAPIRAKPSLSHGEVDLLAFTSDPWVVQYKNLVFLRKIGKGNFGHVFKRAPTWVNLLSLSAMHVFSFSPFFLTFSLCRTLHHPNLMQLIGICKHETSQYIITKLVTGGNLTVGYPFTY